MPEQATPSTTPPQKTSQQRLAQILRSWGSMLPSGEGKKLITDKVPDFSSRLAEADAATMLQMTQVLLANTEVPGVHRRPVIQGFMELLDPQGTVGGHEHDVRLLQALLLATWPRTAPNRATIVPAYLGAALRIAGKAGEEAKSLASWQDEVRSAIEDLPLDDSALTRLLWWGQAQYCDSLKQPYRRVVSPEQVLFCSAFEVARQARPEVGAKDSLIAHALPIEPTAAFLGRHLAALQCDLDVVKTLLTWLGDLHRGLSPESPPLAPKLKKVVAEDALGLPVSWVRHLANTRHDLPSRDAVHEATGLNPDTSLTQEEFVMLLLQETILDRYFDGEDSR